MATANQSSTFRNRLQQLLNRTRWRAAGFGLMRTMVLGGGALLLAAWAVGAENRPTGFIAWGLSLSLLAVLVLVVRNFLVLPLKPWRRARDLVRSVEEQGDFANVLVSAEEAERLPDRWAGSHPVRAELRRRMYLRAEGILDGLTEQRVLTLPHPRVWGLGLAAVVTVAFILVFPNPGDLERGLTRLAKPWPDQVLVPEGGLYGPQGQDFVIAGEDIDLGALDFAGGLEAAVCEIRIGSGGWQRLETRTEPVYDGAVGLPSPYRKWSTVVPEVREDFAWRFRRGAMATEVGQVSVIHHPLVTGLSARVIPPAYTRLPWRDMARLPTWFEVPAGSMVHLAGTANHPVQRAWLVTDAEDTLNLEMDSLKLSGALRITESTFFTVNLKDDFGLQLGVILCQQSTPSR